MERDIEKEICEKLKEIEEEEQVVILRAVESGSRAWGIASPDSDYDVRFIYVRKAEDYLRLDPVKDVIECPLDEVLDINGWDLRKALMQFHRGNATLFEWANSPVVYKSSGIWERIYETAKLYFYALRPLLAANYIEEYEEPAPVLFDDLMKQDLPEELRTEIDTVLKIKQVSDEAEKNPRNPVVQQYIAKELERQKKIVNQMPDDRNHDWAALNQLFLEILQCVVPK